MPTLPTKDTKPSPCSKTLYAGIKISNQRVPKKKIHTRRGTGGEVGRESDDKLQIAEIQTQKENKHLGQ